MSQSPNLKIKGSFVPESRAVFNNGHVSASLIEAFAASSDEHQWVIDMLEVVLQENLAAALTVGVLSGQAQTITSAANGTDLFTKTAHGLKTGDAIRLVTDATITGVTSGDLVYVIRASADTFKVALTHTLALAGTGADITADGATHTAEKCIYLVHFGAAQLDGDNKGFAGIGLPVFSGAAVRLVVDNSGGKGFQINIGAHLSK